MQRCRRLATEAADGGSANIGSGSQSIAAGNELEIELLQAGRQAHGRRSGRKAGHRGIGDIGGDQQIARLAKDRQLAAHAVDLARRAAQIEGRAQSQSLVAIELQVALGADRRQPADRQAVRAAAQLQALIRPAGLLDAQRRAACAINLEHHTADRGQRAAKLERRRRGQCHGRCELLIQLGQASAPGLIAAVAAAVTKPAFDACSCIEMPCARGGLDRQHMVHGVAGELDLHPLDRFAGHHQTLGLEIDAQVAGRQLLRAWRQACHADTTKHRQQHIEPCQLDMGHRRAGLYGVLELELSAGERQRHPRRSETIAQLALDAQTATKPLVEFGKLAGIERQIEVVCRRTEIAPRAQSGRAELQRAVDLAQPIGLIPSRHRTRQRKSIEAAVGQRQIDQRRQLGAGDTRCRESAIDQALRQIGEAGRIEAGKRALQIEAIGLGNACLAAELGSAIACLQLGLSDRQHIAIEPCLGGQRNVLIGQRQIEGQTLADRLECHRPAQGGLAQRRHRAAEIERIGREAQREIGQVR